MGFVDDDASFSLVMLDLSDTRPYLVSEARPGLLGLPPLFSAFSRFPLFPPFLFFV